MADTLADVDNLGNVSQLASQARGQSPPTAEALTGLQKQAHRLLSLTKDAVAGLQTTVDAITTAVAEWELDSATLLITGLPPAIIGSELCVIISVSFDGGVITWDGVFQGVTSDDLNNTVGAVNIYRFVGRSDGNWWCTSVRLQA